MNELNKKLAEWRGWEYDIWKGWICPDTGENFDEAPNFPESLDACHKWLVPDNVSRIEFCFEVDKLRCFLTVVNEGLFDTYIGEVTDKTRLALAFCLAIEEKIDSEVK